MSVLPESAARLEFVHPIVQVKGIRLLQLAKDRLGVELYVVSGYRSNEEQAKLYAQGRDAAGNVVDQSKVVTNAKPGTSAHNFRLAFDIVPLQNGQPWWTAPDSFWLPIYKVAEEVGLDALGDPWGAFLSWDKGHMEEPGSKVIMMNPGLVKLGSSS